MPVAVTTKGDTFFEPANPAGGTMGLTPTLLFARNNSRRGVEIQNLSVKRFSLAFGSKTPIVNSGITLLPGGSWTMTEFTYTPEAIYAVADAAGTVWSGQEF